MFSEIRATTVVSQAPRFSSPPPRFSSPRASVRLSLVGEWRILAALGDDPGADVGARVTFEWLEAPDGIAIIGADPDSEANYRQHYFDSRGVARVYKMSLEDGVWKLWRDEPDFSTLDFSQRFTGTFSTDGTTIVGRWEICHDGTAWEHDFDLTHTRE
jgi:hypothetical protein